MPTTKPPPETPEVLQQQSRDLDWLLEEAKRVYQEVAIRLSDLRRAGDPSAPNKKS